MRGTFQFIFKLLEKRKEISFANLFRKIKKQGQCISLV